MISRESFRLLFAVFLFVAGIASALASKDDDDPTSPNDDDDDRNPRTNLTDYAIDLLQVNEQAGVLTIIADDLKRFRGTPPVTVNGQSFPVIAQKDSMIQIQIPSSGPQSMGDVEVLYSSQGGRLRDKLLVWSGTVTNTFSKDGLTSTGRFRLKFRGNLPRKTKYRLYTSAMRESSLESWDVGGSNNVVRSRTKTCAGSSAWAPADDPATASSFWGAMEIRLTSSLTHDVYLSGTGSVGSCVRETFSDGTSMITGAGWPFLGFPTRVGTANWIAGGSLSSASGYATVWSTFACDNCPAPAAATER